METSVTSLKRVLYFVFFVFKQIFLHLQITVLGRYRNECDMAVILMSFEFSYFTCTLVTKEKTKSVFYESGMTNI